MPKFKAFFKKSGVTPNIGVTSIQTGVKCSVKTH